jgi:hypothetical protein
MNANTNRAAKLTTSPGKPNTGTWLPIDTAPKDVSRSHNDHLYGPRIVVYDPSHNQIVTVRWSQSSMDSKNANFVDDGGGVRYPSHWIRVPHPPAPR